VERAMTRPEEPMADDKTKKPRIDLKARLGKTAVGVGGGTSAVPLPIPGQQSSTPPPHGSAPPRTQSVKPGIAPPPGMSPGIPLPPFGAARSAAAPSKPSAAQQTIKVEVGEEVHEERRKAGKKTMIYAGAAAVVGLILGFAVGGQKSTSDRGKAAQEGAGRLHTEVKAANEKVKELNDKLIAGGEKLKNKEFPAELTKELAAINVPFDATNLEGKSAGSLPPKILRPLLDYTTAVQDLNKTKDSLKNLLGFAQPKIEKFWKEQKEPVALYSVKFAGGGEKMLAELVPNKDTFPFSAAFPDSYTILIPKRDPQTGETKSEEKKVNRWKKGDLTGDNVIPLDTRQTPVLSGEEVLNRLQKAIYDIRLITEGNKESPTDPTPGLVKQGEDLADMLNKAALAR
jgi:hypothetical protein